MFTNNMMFVLVAHYLLEPGDPTKIPSVLQFGNQLVNPFHF